MKHGNSRESVFYLPLRRSATLAASLVAALSVALLTNSELAEATAPAGYDLFWADEFTGSQLDESSWWYRADEKQQSIQLPSNVSVGGGELILNLTPLATPINGFDSAGAGVISQQRFHYGYYETRAKLGDGIDHDNDGVIDEGWHHAFWAMAAEADANGHVLTTFPSFRRTEIDGYENGSSIDIGRLRQHVLPWNAQGNIIQKLPGGDSDVVNLPDGTDYDYHTYGFEWTPAEVRFYVDDQLTIIADYPAEVYEHDQINLWLTGISTNFEDSDQEQSEARYDYFRFYEPGLITVGSTQSQQIGNPSDYTAPVGGTLTHSGFGGQTGNLDAGGIAGDMSVESGGSVSGAGTLYGNLTARSGSVIRVAEQAIAGAGSPASVVSVEDFEGVAPGTAFAAGASTNLLPGWDFFDLGANGSDVVFAVTGGDGTAQEPTDAALVGESQMLFQTSTNIDFATETVGGEPLAGAIAVSNDFDTSGRVDIINADIVLDGFGDSSGANIDSKVVFGFRDTDNWYSLSLVAGNTTGSATRVDLIANVAGERLNVLSAVGSGSFNGAFPEDTLLNAEIIHDSSSGFVSFSVTDTLTGDVLVESFTISDQFLSEGLVGLAMNNDAGGIDNLSVTTQDFLPFEALQTLNVDGDYLQETGGTLEVDVLSDLVHDRLVVSGQAALGGTLSLLTPGGLALSAGDSIVILEADGGVTSQFDEVLAPLVGGLTLEVVYGTTDVQLVVGGVAGDYNGDGTVDGSDYAVWRNSLGQTGSTLAADGNQDGVVDAQDLDVWRQNHGASAAPAAAQSVPVPEPTSLAMLALACGLTSRIRSESYRP